MSNSPIQRRDFLYITEAQAMASYRSRRMLEIFDKPNRYCIKCHSIINNEKCDMCEICEKIEKYEKEIEQLKDEKNKLKCIITFITFKQLNKDVVKNIYDYLSE